MPRFDRPLWASTFRIHYLIVLAMSFGACACNKSAKSKARDLRGGINTDTGESAANNQRYAPSKPPAVAPSGPAASTPVSGPPPIVVTKSNLPVADNWLTYQTRNVVHLRLDGGFLSEGDVLSVSNGTTGHALLVDYPIKGGLTLPSNYSAKAAVQTFDIQLYPSSPQAAGSYAYGDNVITIDVRNSDGRDEKTATFTFELRDFDIMDIAPTSLVAGSQGQSLQTWFNPFGQASSAAGGHVLHNGILNIINE
jgi:hypothetical protein